MNPLTHSRLYCQPLSPSKKTYADAAQLSLDVELSSTSVLDVLGVGLDLLLDGTALAAVALDHGCGTAGEQVGVQQLVDGVPDGLEILGGLDALDEVVLAALLLDDVGGLVGEYADLLVGFLARAALGDDLHDDVLGCLLSSGLVADLHVTNILSRECFGAYHEGELFHHVGANDLGVNDL